jgi:ABC-2 type transport system permease protein
VIPLLALFRKELASLFGSPLAYLTLTGVALVTALIFFDHLRVYNQILFLYSSTSLGGFDAHAIPDFVNLRDQVFLPVMETLGLTLIGLVPLVTMRVFAEERARQTDELLQTTLLTPTTIVAGKFAATFVFVALLLLASFVYPAASILRAGLGLEHLVAVYLGLFVLGLALASIGLACSALTTSQLVAAVLAYAVAFVFYDFSWATTFTGETLGPLLDALSLHPRFGRFSEGLVRVADLVYFAGYAVVAFAVARLSVVQTGVR